MTQTLTYSGEQTTDVSTTQTVIEQSVEIHTDETPTEVSSVSLRLTDDGDVRTIISISATGEIEALEELRAQVAQTAVDLGFESDAETLEVDVES